MDTVWDILYSFGPDLCWVWCHAHIWSSHLLHGKFPGLFECLRGTLLETHFMNALWMLMVDSLVTTSLMAEWPPFSAGAILPGPRGKALLLCFFGKYWNSWIKENGEHLRSCSPAYVIILAQINIKILKKEGKKNSVHKYSWKHGIIVCKYSILTFFCICTFT